VKLVVIRRSLAGLAEAGGGGAARGTMVSEAAKGKRALGREGKLGIRQSRS